MADLPHHLSGAHPGPLSAFLGRDDEIVAILDLLRRPGLRLLTLTGPGGVGKSRLATHVMDLAGTGYAGGATFVPLTAVREPTLILRTLGEALGIAETATRSPWDGVIAILAAQPRLVVLDNLEHMLDAAAGLVSELLTACPPLTVLGTSRRRLGVSGEQVFPVASLDQSTARSLFVARAQAIQPDFGLSPDTTPVVDAICTQLDRLPLAIELAAAWIPVLAPGALLTRLDHRLDLLRDGPRDAPDRQRTMRNAIAWSHDLLADAEQALFRRLAVFVGGFALDAVDAVTNETPDALVPFSGLAAASLVLRMDANGNDPRFTMLETVREYALEQLAASGEEAAIRERHARYIIGLAEHFWDEPAWPLRDRLLRPLRIEIANIRLALEWALTHDPPMAVQLAGALIDYWIAFGHTREGWAWVTRALDAAPDAQSSAHARALLAAGRLATSMGEPGPASIHLTLAEAHLRELVEHAPTDANHYLLTFAVVLRGDAALARGELDEAQHRFAEARLLAEQHALPMLVTLAVMNMGRIAHFSGDLPAAQHLLEEALARHRITSGPTGVAFGHMFLGELLLDRNNRIQAVEHFQQAFTAFADSGQLNSAGWSLEELAEATVTSAPEAAARLLGAAALLDQDADPRLGDDAHMYARLRQTARDRLGETAFAEAWEAGWRMTLDEVRCAVQDLAESVAALAPGVSPDNLHGLSPRELEVLRLIAAGRTNREIADILFISVPTVKRHITTILGKLALPSRSAATAWAHTHGLA